MDGPLRHGGAAADGAHTELVSILVVVDGPLRLWTDFRTIDGTPGFNPCCRGWTSEAAPGYFWESVRVDVSILVVVDGPLRPGQRRGHCHARRGFNPCCRGWTSEAPA